jgi:hypothetical protein
MKPYAQEAEIKRLEFMTGLITVSDVIAWADSLIEQMDIPDSEIIDLSLAGHSNSYELISILSEMAIGSDRFAAMKTVFGKMYSVLSQDVSHARKYSSAIMDFVVENHYNLPDDFYFMYGIDDAFELAEIGIYGSVDEISKRFIEELKPFCDDPR